MWCQGGRGYFKKYHNPRQVVFSRACSSSLRLQLHVYICTKSTASRHPIIGVCMVAWERTYYFTLFLVLYNCAYSMQYKPVSMKYQQYLHYICKKCATVLRDFLFYNRVCIISVSRHLTPQVTVTPSTCTSPLPKSASHYTHLLVLLTGAVQNSQ